MKTLLNIIIEMWVDFLNLIYPNVDKPLSKSDFEVWFVTGFIVLAAVLFWWANYW